MKNILKNIGYFLLTLLMITSFLVVFALVGSLIMAGVALLFKALSLNIIFAGIFCVSFCIVSLTSVLFKETRSFFEERKKG